MCLCLRYLYFTFGFALSSPFLQYMYNVLFRTLYRRGHFFSPKNYHIQHLRVKCWMVEFQLAGNVEWKLQTLINDALLLSWSCQWWNMKNRNQYFNTWKSQIVVKLLLKSKFESSYRLKLLYLNKSLWTRESSTIVATKTNEKLKFITSYQ